MLGTRAARPPYLQGPGEDAHQRTALPSLLLLLLLSLSSEGEHPQRSPRCLLCVSSSFLGAPDSSVEISVPVYMDGLGLAIVVGGLDSCAAESLDYFWGNS